MRHASVVARRIASLGSRGLRQRIRRRGGAIRRRQWRREGRRQRQRRRRRDGGQRWHRLARWLGRNGGQRAGSAGNAGNAGNGGTAGGSGGTAGTAGNGGTAGTGAGCGAAPSVQCGTGGPCSFPQGVPDPDFYHWACTFQETDKSVDDAVNAVMANLSGCGVGSDCVITTVGGSTINEICQNWFAAVAAELRNQGYCAGQHAESSTDEIAVSNTCCEGKWYGYHICNYGGGKVVWNPGARRGWWMIKPSYCAP